MSYPNPFRPLDHAADGSSMMGGVDNGSIDGFTDNYEAGAIARARAAECDVPDPQEVIRVTFDGAPVFHYGDGRQPYPLPPLQEG